MNQATAVCRRHSQQVGRCAIMDDEMSRRPRTASARARTKVVAASLAQTRGCFSPLPHPPPPLSRILEVLPSAASIVAIFLSTSQTPSADAMMAHAFSHHFLLDEESHRRSAPEFLAGLPGLIPYQADFPSGRRRKASEPSSSTFDLT